MMDPNNCPPADLIAAFAAGELEANHLVAVREHVSHCETCLEMVGHLATDAQGERAAATSHLALAHPILAHPAFAEAGQSIGPYLLVRRVGEGGMGEVWEAQQSTPVRRRVALKLLKAGMDTRQIVSRFEAERQVLARMQHANIAQVFDAGVTDSGRPYFVMEFVEGVRITAYCDEAGLDVRERLALFQQVCEAVQHAHQKGVIHRDLKPSNILVTGHGPEAAPKVIDFGLAKAVTQDDADHSLTELGTVIGTPAYASPEQMGLGARDVDTRTDVYSLGVLLYELLIGVIPYELNKHSLTLMPDLRQSAHQADPARPSARLSALGVKVPEIVKARSTDEKALRRQLRGDLDWVVMKALEKDRERRYASPHDLALDVERHLRHEPLLAGPPAASYRLRKFVSRHRVGTAFAATLACVILAFIVVTVIQVRRISIERDRATAAAARADSISRFLLDTLSYTDPWENGKEMSVGDVLARATDKVATEFKDQPLAAAAVERSIGKTFDTLGRRDEAEKLLGRALTTLKGDPGSDQDEILENMLDLSFIYTEQGKISEARKLAEEALSLARKLHGDHDATVAIALERMSSAEFVAGDFRASLRLANEALAMSEQVFGPESLETAERLTTVVSTLTNGAGDLRYAEQCAKRALEITRTKLGANHVKVIVPLGVLGVLYARMKRLDESAQLFAEALRIGQKELGDDNPDVVDMKESYANLLGQLGRYEESLQRMGEVVALRKAKQGEDSPNFARVLGSFAHMQSLAGQLEQSERTFARAIPLIGRLYGEQHPWYLRTVTYYAELLRKRHEDERAEPLLREALATQAVALEADNPDTAATRLALGELLTDRGSYAEAEPLLRQARSSRAAFFGPENAATKEVDAALARLNAAWHEKPEGAVPKRASAER